MLTSQKKGLFQHGSVNGTFWKISVSYFYRALHLKFIFRLTQYAFNLSLFLLYNCETRLTVHNLIMFPVKRPVENYYVYLEKRYRLLNLLFCVMYPLRKYCNYYCCTFCCSAFDNIHTGRYLIIIKQTYDRIYYMNWIKIRLRWR